MWKLTLGQEPKPATLFQYVIEIKYYMAKTRVMSYELRKLKSLKAYVKLVTSLT